MKHITKGLKDIPISEDLETLYEDLKVSYIHNESYDLTLQEVNTLLDLLDALGIE